MTCQIMIEHDKQMTSNDELLIIKFQIDDRLVIRKTINNDNAIAFTLVNHWLRVARKVKLDSQTMLYTRLVLIFKHSNNTTETSWSIQIMSNNFDSTSPYSVRFLGTLSIVTFGYPFQLHIQTELVGGFNPVERYARQIGFIFPKVRGENKKSLSCHHLENMSKHPFWLSITWAPGPWEVLLLFMFSSWLVSTLHPQSLIWNPKMTGFQKKSPEIQQLFFKLQVKCQVSNLRLATGFEQTL